MSKVKFKYVLYEKEGRLAKITINRPEKLNAFLPEGYGEVKWALVQAEMDDEVAVVIITGAGKAFSTGGDLKYIAKQHESKEMKWIEGQRYTEEVGLAVRQAETMSKPIIAMVNGICWAGGLEIAMSCDVIIAAEDATFCFPEARFGIVTATFPARLQHLVGLAQAKYLLLTSDVIDAREAERIGLIYKAVPRDELLPTVLKVADKLMETAPRAKAWYKWTIHNALPGMEFKFQVESQRSEETTKGTQEFSEGRRPAWY